MSNKKGLAKHCEYLESKIRKKQFKLNELREQIRQRDEVVGKCINKLGRYADEMANNGNAYAICVDLLDTLQRYKGDNE